MRSDGGDEIAHSAADVVRLGDETIALRRIEQRAKGAIGIAAIRGLAEDGNRIDAASCQPFIDCDPRFGRRLADERSEPGPASPPLQLRSVLSLEDG